MLLAEIAALRFANQGLAGAPFNTPAAVVDWLVAVQAQDYYGAQWSLGQRMGTATEAVLETAMTQGTILRTHVLRPTWHFVAPADIRWLLALTGPRVKQAVGGMLRRVELDPDTLNRSNDGLAAALEGGRQLTRDELREVLERAGIRAGDGLRLAHIVMIAELDGIICSGARRGKQFTYALLDERAPHARRLSPDEALAELSRRYFTSRGPASVYDFAWWSGLTVTSAREGLAMVADRFERAELDGQEYWFSAERPLAAVSAPPRAYLLSIYDEIISGYTDRSPIVDEPVWQRFTAPGNGLRSLVILDGRVVGTWKRSLEKGFVTVETELYAPVDASGMEAIEQAAQRYAAFLGRDLLKK